MSKQETVRLQVVEQVKSGRLKQLEAASRLGLSTRHLRRLIRKYEKYGAKGLVSGHRGKASNHQLPSHLKQSALDIIKAHYADFGPTLAQEYLNKHHHIKLGVETLRQLMIRHGLWDSRRKKKKRIHQQRLRRERFGELVQIDGSHHDWFEGRAPKCCLLVFIDDATGALLHLFFCESETTFNYFEASGTYFKKYGLPMAFYSDKHVVFRVNMKDGESAAGQTQFARAMDDLGVELIYANTPQAKGRVERANATLQDRLVKAMRIEGICSIEEANAYLPAFIEEFNERFARPPESEANAHCELQLENGALDHHLSIHSERTVTAQLECTYHHVTYQIQAQEMKHRLSGKSVTFVENARGHIRLFYRGKALKYKTIVKGSRLLEAHDDKTINMAVDKLCSKKRKAPYKPPASHVWRRFQINPERQASKQACT